MQEKRHAQNEHVFLNITCFIAGAPTVVLFSFGMVTRTPSNTANLFHTVSIHIFYGLTFVKARVLRTFFIFFASSVSMRAPVSVISTLSNTFSEISAR